MRSARSLSLVVALFCLLALVGLCGCPPPAPPGANATSTTPQTPTGPPIKIGAIFSTTGAAGAPLGTPEKATVEMLVAALNAQGGIHGRPLEVDLQDDQSDPTLAATAAKKLLDEKVVAVIGPTLSGPSLGVMKAFEDAKVPLVSCAASVKITRPAQPYVFSTAQPDTLAVARLMEYLKSKKITKIAVLYDSNPFGKSGFDVLTAQAPKNGITLVDSESFESKDTDMTTQLTKAKDKNPQALVCWGTNPGPAIVAKNVKALKITVPLLMSHGIANHKFIELAGDAAEGVVFPAGKLLLADSLPASDPQKGVLLAYAQAYQAKYQKPADTFGGHASDAFNLVVQALQTAGDDPAKIRDAIEATRGFVGISGLFNLSPTDHNGLTKDAFVMVTIKGGKWVAAD